MSASKKARNIKQYNVTISKLIKLILDLNEEHQEALLKKGRHELNVETINEYIHTLRLDGVEPLYTVADAEQALEYFDDYPYRHPVTVGQDITCTLYDAGHILGSAMSLITVRTNGISRTIAYTGDIGRFNTLIIKDPCLEFAKEDRDVDLLIMESTYGNREHESLTDLKPRLQRVLIETFERGGTVLIPAFAFGRTQTLLYLLHEMYSEKTVPRVPVYVDSPLATNLTRVYGEHFEAYDKETHAVFLEKGMNPFQFEKMHFVGSVEESMALNRQDRPQILLEKDVSRAIIAENLFTGSERIINKSEGKVQIGLNISD